MLRINKESAYELINNLSQDEIKKVYHDLERGDITENNYLNALLYDGEMVYFTRLNRNILLDVVKDVMSDRNIR